MEGVQCLAYSDGGDVQWTGDIVQSRRTANRHVDLEAIWYGAGFQSGQRCHDLGVFGDGARSGRGCFVLHLFKYQIPFRRTSNILKKVGKHLVAPSKGLGMAGYQLQPGRGVRANGVPSCGGSEGTSTKSGHRVSHELHKAFSSLEFRNSCAVRDRFLRL